MSKTEDLKQVAHLRQAILPLVGLLKNEANAELTKRLESVEALVRELAGKKPEPPQVDVVVETPEALTKMVNDLMKMQKSTVKEESTGYQPHDQAKTATFQYSGFAKSSGEWYIQRVAKGEQRYIMGKGNYADAWESRDKHKYGYIDG